MAKLILSKSSSDWGPGHSECDKMVKVIEVVRWRLGEGDGDVHG